MLYRKASEEVSVVATKWDNCKIVTTELKYRHQPGSGRSEIFKVISNGMTVGEYTKLAAERGFDAKFAVGSILKHANSQLAAFRLEAPEGTTLEEIKSQRQSRGMTEARRAAIAAAKAAKAEARAAAKAEREARIAEAKAKKEELRAAAKAARAATKKAASKKAKVNGEQASV